MKALAPKVGVLLAFVLPSASMACPTRSDVSAGVRIEYETGSYDIHTRLDESNVSSEFYSDEGKRRATRVTSYGVFETEITYFYEASGELDASYTFSYSFDPSVYFPISEGLSVNGRQFELADFGKSFSNRYHVEFGSSMSVRIGDCEYAIIPVFLTYGSWWDQDEDQGVYISELGIFLEGDVTNQSGMNWMQRASITVVAK